MAEKLKVVGQEHVFFKDKQKGSAVLAVPLTKALYIPRSGESLSLPAMREGDPENYRVDTVIYIYEKDEDPAGINTGRLARVVVQVKAVT